MKRIMSLLAMMAVCSAWTASDYLVLDHVEAGPVEGCAYYSITNPTLSVIDVKSGENMLSVDRWEVAYGELESSYWEEWAPVRRSVNAYVPGECHVEQTLNGTKETVCEEGYYSAESSYTMGWVPLDPSKLDLQSGKTKQVRLCGKYSMDRLPDGTLGVAMDHKPSFMGYVFDGTDGPDYAWWNVSYSSYSKVTIPGAWANGTYLLANDTWFQAMNLTSNLSDLVCLFNNATRLGIWVENSTAGGGANRTWVYARANTTIDCYGGCSGACADYTDDITEAFPHAWAPGNCNEGWHNSTHVTMNDTGDYCRVQMTALAALDPGYWNFGMSVPAEYRMRSYWLADNASTWMTRSAGQDAAYSSNNWHYAFIFQGQTLVYYGGGSTDLGDPPNLPYKIYQGQINSSHSRLRVFNHDYTFNATTGNHTPQAGAPVTFKYLSWEDGSAAQSKYNTEYIEWAFLRQISPDFQEPVLGFAAPIGAGGVVNPVIENITISPGFPVTADDLNCSFNASIESTDNISISGWWYVNGTVDNTLNFSLINITSNTTNWSILASGNTTQHENWSCRVYAYTAGGGGSSYNFSQNVTIWNQVPVINALQLNNYAPRYDNDLICSYQALDADSDLMTGTFYWFKGGVLQNALNHTDSGITTGSIKTNTVLAGNTSVGESWVCRVNLTDGFNTSSSDTAAALITNYSWPDVWHLSPTAYYRFDTSNMQFQFMCNGSETATLTGYLYINGTQRNSTTCTNNSACTLYSSALEVCDWNNWSIRCTDTAARTNLSSNRSYGYELQPYYISPTPANLSIYAPSTSVTPTSYLICEPLSAVAEWNGSNHTLTCTSSTCPYTNTTSATWGASIYYRIFTSNSSGQFNTTGWRVVFTENESIHLNITLENFSFTKNYTWAEFDEFQQDFVADWGAWIFAIFVYGCAFILSSSYPQIAISGGVGLMAVYLVTGMAYPVIGAAAVLSLVLGAVLKYVSG